MPVQDILLTALSGVILGAVLINTYRIGRLTNGDGGYFHCPFYKGHIEDVKKSNRRGGT